ncbi:hypothetical protein [Streptomyces acidicola]|uniref:Uncharacterized protein n=1 Tax=Streptomyces acidicola TaxID=2596892 RepID=A0A5N8WS26_9ACTN|nr:hypothetical protein [Streptomyces acidicola]MPY49942.1 hypothetical protein [Streptomyces acidicola]
MTTHQVAGGTHAPIAATLNTPPWARAETPQGRSQAESRRTADRAAHTPADDTTRVSAFPALPAQRSPTMSRDIDPALPVQPSPGHQATTPASPNPSRRLAQRLRIMAARTRAIAWKLVKLSGEEYIKGFANKAGAITAPVLGVGAVAYVLGVDPADAVRRMLGM